MAVKQSAITHCSPIAAIERCTKSERRSFELHYSARTYSELAFRNRIKQVAGDSVHFYASRDPHSQRLELDRLLSTPKPGVHVYICGPRRMISAVGEMAVVQGWPSAQIHFENFGAQPLAGPVYQQETLIRADIDLGEIVKARYDLDVAGHYARSDIF